MKLTALAILACAACCSPLVIAFVFTILAGGVFVTGQWIIGALLLLGATYFVVKRLRKVRECPASGQCGCESV